MIKELENVFCSVRSKCNYVQWTFKFSWMPRLRLIDYGREPVLDAETSLRDSSTEHRRGVGNTTELMTMATKLF